MFRSVTDSVEIVREPPFVLTPRASKVLGSGLNARPAPPSTRPLVLGGKGKERVSIIRKVGREGVRAQVGGATERLEPMGKLRKMKIARKKSK